MLLDFYNKQKAKQPNHHPLNPILPNEPQIKVQ